MPWQGIYGKKSTMTEPDKTMAVIVEEVARLFAIIEAQGERIEALEALVSQLRAAVVERRNDRISLVSSLAAPSAHFGRAG
jgi:hypothetical protein